MGVERFMGCKQPTAGAATEAKIVFQDGALRGHVLALEKARSSIGRDSRNDIAINDPLISSFHAAISRDLEGAHWIEDLNSKNGTFLEGKRILRERLHDGAVFSLCATGPRIQFTTGEPSLPSILGSTTATFLRTRSVGQALGELWPRSSAPGKILTMSGVRRILDYKLEEATRRSRLISIALVAGFFLLSAAMLGGALYIIGGKGAGIDREGASGPVAVLPAPPAPPAPGPGALSVKLSAKLQPIYGGLFLSYREKPLGEIEVENGGESPLSGCALSLRFEGPASSFLVEPFRVALPEVAPHSKATVPIALKLSTEVLSDQTREVTACLSLKRGEASLGEVVQAVFVHGRNTFSWEKPEGVAAFVDPNDPAVTSFVRSVWGCRPPTSQSEFPPSNLVGALTLLTAIAELGLRYLPDSTSPISERVDWKANDRVCYPGETLLSRTGDCDDLSVLCTAVLEAARIPTALVVGSSHILFLLDSGIRAADLSETPFNPGTVVVWKGRVWLPIESTDFARPGSNFASAWAAAWVRCPPISSGEMKAVEMAEAWRQYQPMNPPPGEAVRRSIESARWAGEGLCARIEFALAEVRKLFRSNLDGHVEEIRRSQPEGPGRGLEEGLLYSRSGLFEDARRAFERALFGEEGPPEARRLEEWGKKLTEETAIILSDLAICLVQAPRSAGDLISAAGYQELALAGLSGGSAMEKGEMMLRLALIHRLRGDLSAERRFCQKAFGIDRALELTYKDLVAGGGPVAGTEEKVLRYLREGLRRRPKGA